jgi:hypothetical protein
MPKKIVKNNLINMEMMNFIKMALNMLNTTRHDNKMAHKNTIIFNGIHHGSRNVKSLQYL